jgi:predicted CoA-binding protein
MGEIVDVASVRRVLEEARTIAVLGGHVDPDRPAHYVPEYLAGQGYQILTVNPRFAGQTLWGQPVVATLAELDTPVDIVDVFRRPDKIPEHLDDILAMQPRPRVVWLQLGIRNDRAARRLIDAGIEVVQDRCTLADHRAFRLGPVPARRN